MKTKFDNRMSFCMRKTPEGLSSFIEYWAGIYKDSIEYLYENNIEKDLNSKNIFDLYHWKYGQEPKSENHQRTINNNYVSYLSKYKSCPPTHDELKVEYLNHRDKKGTAPVWNIFFLHVLSKNKHFNKNLNKYVYPILTSMFIVLCILYNQKTLRNQNYLENYQVLMNNLVLQLMKRIEIFIKI